MTIPDLEGVYEGMGGGALQAQAPSVPTEGQPISNTRLVAELQAVALGIHLVGLDRLPEVVRGGCSADQA